MLSNDRAIGKEVPFPLCDKSSIHEDLILSISPLKQQIETLPADRLSGGSDR